MFKKCILVGLLYLTVFYGAACLQAGAPTLGPAAISPDARTSTVAPNKVAWETEWAKVVDLGKKEGSVVIYTGLDSGAKDAVQAAFRDKYGISVEWDSAMGAALLAKVRAQKSAGLNLGDVILSGAATQMNFKDAGFLDPVETAMILPEVKDPKAWTNGRIHFYDKDHYTMAYWATVSTTWFINTEMLKPEEAASYQDLLNPKWKGKMILVDPSTPGPGSKFMNINAWEIMGENYVRALAKQEPVVTRDQRLQVESVARGKYPIGLGPQSEVRVSFQRQGAPVRTILPTEGGALTSAAGGLGILSRPAHPNAMRLFVNWLLSKEGQTVIGKGGGAASRRADVPTDFVDEEKLPKPGGKYLEGDTEETILREVERQALDREIFNIR